MQGMRIVGGARYGLVLAGVAGALMLGACAEPVQPRNFADFMEDRIAREGTLARCNADREATLNDIECANARRAAAAIALRRERERREVLERESEMKLAALRREMELRDARARAEAEIAAAERERAYNRLWQEKETAAAADTLAPVGLGGGATARPDSLAAPDNAPSPVAGAPGSMLEEVKVPSRFTWRPAVD